jgi:hypothetical protein
MKTVVASEIHQGSGVPGDGFNVDALQDVGRLFEVGLAHRYRRIELL